MSEQEQDRVIPLKDNATEAVQIKKGSGWLSFWLILAGLAALLLSPLPSYLASLIPKSIINSAMKPVAQKIILDENPIIFDAPRKYAQKEALPVLGRASGLCFTFAELDEKRLKRAKHGRKIAEIIAVSADNKEYKLDEVTLTDTKQSKIICQSFSRKDSAVPKSITAIYIRPLSPFAPTKVTWASMREFK